jgi:hypothetical protein
VAVIAIALAATGGIIAGLFLPRTLRFTGRFFVPSMLFVISIGFMLLNNAGVIALVFGATFITGFGNRSMYPVFFLKATQGDPKILFCEGHVNSFGHNIYWPVSGT